MNVSAQIKRVIAISVSMLLISVQVVLAQDGIWGRILQFGNLEFLGCNDSVQFVSFSRILIWVALFAFIKYTTSWQMGSGKPMFPRNISTVLSIVAAFLGSINIPGELILAIGGLYGTVAVWFMFGILVIGLMILTFRVIRPDDGRGSGKPPEPMSAYYHIVRIILLISIFLFVGMANDAIVPFTNIGGLCP